MDGQIDRDLKSEPEYLLLPVFCLSQRIQIELRHKLSLCPSVRWMDGRKDVWMDGWINGWMDSQTDGWIHGWTDREMVFVSELYLNPLAQSKYWQSRYSGSDLDSLFKRQT